MSTETVTQAVAEREKGPGTVVAEYTPIFANVLPSHLKAETFVRLSQGVLRRDPKLARVARANPASLMAALMDCARLGHEPGTEAYYLVPFGNEIQGIEGYRGQIERIYRAGAVSTVKAEVVRANDHFAYDPQTMDQPEHRPDWFAEDRGPLIGVYAYAVMVDGGTSRVVVMNKTTVMKHKAASKSSSGADSPWQKWEESMWLKTGVHELEKWVPSSAEYRREQLRALAEADQVRHAQTPQHAHPVIEDAEVVEETGEAKP